jgi:hypothetical protein
MAALISELTEDLNRLEDDARHRGIWRRLTGVLVVLCGALAIGGDALVGAVAAPVTVGVSAAGAAVSIGIGTEVISLGVDRARES